MILLAFLSFVTFAQARTVTEPFASNKHKLPSDMVWNIARGELHPPLLVKDWRDEFNNLHDSPLEVGDGRHGAFIRSRYSFFSDGGNLSGNIIRINTDKYTDLNFTSFNLEAGWKIRPTGSRALVIRSQSDIMIDGEIDCDGENGLDAVSNPMVSLFGGTGRCGGGNGGNSVPGGVPPDVDIHKGKPGGPSVTGGAGGPACLPTGGQGGGGGGAYHELGGVKPNPQPGDDSDGGIGGAVGTMFRDDGFAIDVDGGGSGGGGGSAFNDVSDPVEIPNHSSGGSGGGGGGTIRMYAVGNITIGAAGYVHANGGNGGSVPGTWKGGGGGGGGGGSILMWAGGDIDLGPDPLAPPTVKAAPGLGGASAGGDGGRGGWGRTFIVDNNGAPTGPFEDPVTTLQSPGDVRYETLVPYVVESKAIDVGNTKPTPTAADLTVLNQGGADVDLDLSFSDSDSISSFPAFAPASDWLDMEQKRFVRFRISIDANPSALNPIRIPLFTLEYNGIEQDDFDFVTGCGTTGGEGPHHGWLYLAIFMLPLVAYFRLRFSSAISQCEI